MPLTNGRKRGSFCDRLVCSLKDQISSTGGESKGRQLANQPALLPLSLPCVPLNVAVSFDQRLRLEKRSDEIAGSSAVPYNQPWFLLSRARGAVRNVEPAKKTS